VPIAPLSGTAIDAQNDHPFSWLFCVGRKKKGMVIIMQNSLAILYTCLSKLDSEGTYKSHSHPYSQLNHIIKGEFTYIVDGVTYYVRPGDTILIPQNSVHSFTVARPEDGYYYEIKFSSFSKADKEICDDAGIFTQNDEHSLKLIMAIYEENENLTTLSEQIMVNYLYSLLYQLGTEARRKKSAPSKYIEVVAYTEPVRCTIRYLEDNYTRQLTLDDIVSNTELKKSSLCRIFKDETSLTIFECLMIIRVRRAVELLTFTGMTLAQISQETAFVNLTHFNRVFTKHVMIPPGQFRRHKLMQAEYLHNVKGDPESNPIANAALSGNKIDIMAIKQS